MRQMSDCMSDTVNKSRDTHLAGKNITETGSPRACASLEMVP